MRLQSNFVSTSHIDNISRYPLQSDRSGCADVKYDIFSPSEQNQEEFPTKNSIELDRMVDWVKPWFMVHGSVHGSGHGSVYGSFHSLVHGLVHGSRFIITFKFSLLLWTVDRG